MTAEETAEDDGKKKRREIVPTSGGSLREAEEVFIFMHRNFRVSRNIRAHWFFDHINKPISIEGSPTPTDIEDYAQEMSVVGIVPKGGRPDEIVGREQFLVTHETKVVYISRYYRHVFVLDLSPSSVVADEDTNSCLHQKLLECLRLCLESVTKQFTKPGTEKAFIPQIYVSVVVFVPFLTFEQDLVLAHSVRVTHENVGEVLEEVTQKFNELVKSLYRFSRPIMHRWAHLRRIHKNRYESTRESEMDYLDCSLMRDDSLGPMDIYTTQHTQRFSAYTKDVVYPHERDLATVAFPKRVFESEEAEADRPVNEVSCDGYIIPEWALIFMLRLGLISVQTLPENTQSNIVVITDGVAGMPDPQALQDILNQMRSFTVSCSFIELKGKSRNEACFGHVTSCELFHFLAMGTFGGYIPNCRCSNVVCDIGPTRSEFMPINPFHKSLLCWSFQNALQDNKHITNLVNEINPVFASLYKNKNVFQVEFNRTYTSTLNELLYVRLREGFTVKSVEVLKETGRINIHLSLPFRPLVFLEYVINASWPSCRTKREAIAVDLAVDGPESEIRDLKLKDKGGIQEYNPLRLKLIDTLKNTIHKIEEADALLIHIHSFNTDPAYYSLPRGADDYPIYHTEDTRRGIQMGSGNRPTVVPIVRSKSSQDTFAKFLRFWEKLCGMNQDNWQKWVHVHFERVILNCKTLPCNIFVNQGIKVNCSEAALAVHNLLKQRSSFCLIRDQLYVTFVKREKEQHPCYFYMVHVSQETPCMIMKVAFLGGISSTERRRVVEHLRNSLDALKMGTAKRRNLAKAVTVIRRPLERIVIRYHQMPNTLKTIFRLKGDSDEAMEQAMHSAVNKYLVGRRRVWRLPLSVLLDSPDDYKNTRRVAEFVLSVLLHRRLHEGFSIAWVHGNIVGLCRQVTSTKLEIPEDSASARQVLEQYILFHPANRTTDDEMRNRATAPGGLVLVAELWKEPCAKDEEFPQMRPTSESDNELVSVLFTVNHLLLLCSNYTGQLSFVEQKDEQVETQVSRCVTVVTNAFNLYSLLKNSRRLLLHLPTYNTGSPEDDARFSALHNALLTEFGLFSHVFVDIEDPCFFARIFSRLLLDAEHGDLVNQEEVESVGYDKKYEARCRLFLRKVNPWVAMVVLVPERRMLPDRADFPIVVSVCDEALLAYGMVKQKQVGRVTEFVLNKSGDVIGDVFPEEQLESDDVVLEWVSNDREDRTLRTNYVQIRMRSVVEELSQTVVDRALISTMNALLRQGVPVPKDDVTWMMEGVCDYTTIEVEAVTQALETFCAHMKPNAVRNRTACCDESNLKKVFDDVLGKRFHPVPGNPNYFYFNPPAREEPRPRPARSDNLNADDAQPRRKNSTIVNPVNIAPVAVAPPTVTPAPIVNGVGAGDVSPDEDSLTDSVVPRVQHSISEPGPSNNAGGAGDGLAVPNVRKRNTRSKSKKDDREAPLFVYFHCVVQFDGGEETYCPVTFLPSCIHQILRLCNLPTNEDPANVKIKLLVYILSWPPPKTPEHNYGWSEDEEEDDFSKRSQRFLSKLPDKERMAVNELLSTMNRVLELESLLMDSRRDDISHDKLQKISNFIAREVGDRFSDNGRHELCKKNGVAGRMTQRYRDLAIVIPSEKAKAELMRRLEGMVVDYCVLRRSGNSNLYYICKVEDREAFEEQVRTHLARHNNGDVAAGEVIPGETARSIFELMTRKDLLCDFWVILTIEKEVNLQFCQRYATEPSHYKIYDLTWKMCRQIIRNINQELLLDHMFEYRECDPLLLTSVPVLGSTQTTETVEQDESSPISGTTRYTFSPGSFACPVQWMKWFEIHPRLRRKSYHHSGVLYDAAKKLMTALEQHAVNGIPNTYVFKEENGNVFYLQMYTSFNVFTTCMKNYSVELTKAEIKEAETRMGSNTCILLAGFGVRKPSDDYMKRLTEELLEKRLKNYVLDELIEIWKRNQRALLEPSDIEFIQPNPNRPTAVMYFSLPSDLGRFTSAVSYYYHQYLQIYMYAARPRETQSGEVRPFRHYPFASLPNQEIGYVPIFYLFLKGGQGGSRSKGMACVEMRIVNLKGVMEPLSDGVLRIDSHKTLVKYSDNPTVVRSAFEELTTSRCYVVKEAAVPEGETPLPPSGEHKGTCGFIQVIFWEAGDVGIDELKDTLHTFAEQAYCDVVTEYGILNVNIMESSPQTLLPPSSPITTTPQKTPKSSPAPTDARRSFRKRDSTETLHQLPSETSSSSSAIKRGSSGMSFENRRGSIASELGREDLVFPPSRERAPDRISPSFYPYVEEWLDYVVSNKEFYSFERAVYTFDSHLIVRKALFMLRDRLADLLHVNFPNLCDSVITCQRICKPTESYYEVLRENGYDLDNTPPSDGTPQYLLLAYSPEVAKESQRYGYERTSSAPPQALTQLVDKLDRKDCLWNFLPCLSPLFIPRQRLLYCSVKEGKLTLYMYNYMPAKKEEIKSLFTRVIYWYNARARLIREIGRHETKALLPQFEHDISNTYMSLVYRHPLALINNDFPPDKVQYPVGFSVTHDMANKLLKTRTKTRVSFDNEKCPVERQLRYFRAKREEVEKQLAQFEKLKAMHEGLMRGEDTIPEVDLMLLQGLARRVHFVQTPVLLFPHWRRKIAEVRSTAQTHKSNDSGRPPSLPSRNNTSALASGTTAREGFRARASTFNHQNRYSSSSGVIRQPTIYGKDDEDPCQILMLYKLMQQYVKYLEVLGLKMFKVEHLDISSKERNYYTTEYRKTIRYAPVVHMYRAVKAGVVMVRLFFVQPYFIIAVGVWTEPQMTLKDSKDKAAMKEVKELEKEKDTVVSKCHLHSFTYDFHLRMIKRYLVYKEVLFSHGYNTNTFLIDFLKYYGCRPPNARNGVYEERLSYTLLESISADNIWECFLERFYVEKDSWRVVGIRVTEEEVNDPSNRSHNNEYMLVSTDTDENEQYSKISVLLRDRRRKEPSHGAINLVLYLILIDKEQSGPLEDTVRQRENSRQSELGVFMNVPQIIEELQQQQAAALPPPPVNEIDSLMTVIRSGNIPTIDGGKRRFSSGGPPAANASGEQSQQQEAQPLVQEQPKESEMPPPQQPQPQTEPDSTGTAGTGSPMTMRNSDSDLSSATKGAGTLRHRSSQVDCEDGEIPFDKVCYVQFLNNAQKGLQKRLEEMTTDHAEIVNRIVDEANQECRKQFLWRAICALPRNQPALPRLGVLAKGGSPEQIWDILRNHILHDVPINYINQLLPLVEFENMDRREDRLRHLLQGTSCARLCRFLTYKFTPSRCRMLESNGRDQPPPEEIDESMRELFPLRKALVITDPDNPVLFLVICREETTPALFMLFRKSIKKDDKFFAALMDKAFDELVQCVIAFLWADLVYKPPGKSNS